LTRNPGLSATTTGTLPSLRTSSTSVAVVSSSVVRARTTSTSCIRWTGLKKCSPATRSGCGVASAMRVTDRADVFDASTADAGNRSASWRNTSRFTSSRSTTASMTRSVPASGPQSLAGMTLWRTASASARVNAPLATASAVSDSIRFTPAATSSALMSLSTTETPLAARSCAIPAPITPAPSTATRCTGRGPTSSGTHVERLRARSRWKNTSIRLRAAGVNTTRTNSSRSAANPASCGPRNPASTARSAAGSAG